MTLHARPGHPDSAIASPSTTFAALCLWCLHPIALAGDASPAQPAEAEIECPKCKGFVVVTVMVRPLSVPTSARAGEKGAT